MRTLIIHNPKSGFGSDAIFQFQRSLMHAGDECVMRILEDGQPCVELCPDAATFDVIVISGGDGTISSLLFALRDTGKPICVFPSGTANLLFANIGNAPEPSALARACRTGMTATLDLAQISWEDERGSTHSTGFALMSGTGFDAQLMKTALPDKAALGEAAYFLAVFRTGQPPVEHFTITVDGQVYERDGISCIVANNAMMQGEIEIIPDCRMDDGLLDVIIFETQDATQLLSPLLSGILDHTGKSMGRPFIESFRGRRIRVEATRPVPLEIDGDVGMGNVRWYEAEVVPHTSTVIVDTMSPYAPKNPSTPKFGDAGEIAYPPIP